MSSVVCVCWCVTPAHVCLDAQYMRTIKVRASERALFLAHSLLCTGLPLSAQDPHTSTVGKFQLLHFSIKCPCTIFTDECAPAVGGACITSLSTASVVAFLSVSA